MRKLICAFFIMGLGGASLAADAEEGGDKDKDRAKADGARARAGGAGASVEELLNGVSVHNHSDVVVIPPPACALSFCVRRCRESSHLFNFCGRHECVRPRGRPECVLRHLGMCK